MASKSNYEEHFEEPSLETIVIFLLVKEKRSHINWNESQVCSFDVAGRS